MTQSQNSFSVKLSSCLTCAAVSVGKWPLNERFIVAFVSIQSVKESGSVCFFVGSAWMNFCDVFWTGIR